MNKGSASLIVISYTLPIPAICSQVGNSFYQLTYRLMKQLNTKCVF